MNRTWRMKLVIVGDGGVGKTCMLIRHVKKKYPNDYIPTIFENYIGDEVLDGNVYELVYFDRAGGEDYWRLRPLSYPQTDVFLLCFAVDSHDSFENIRTMWIPELKSWCPEVPILLCATKIDLRYNEQFSDQASWERKCITYAEGEALAEEIGASYVETSSLKNDGLEECFQEAVRLGASYPRKYHTTRRWNPLAKKSDGFPKLWPPPIPPKWGAKPTVKVDKSTFVEDWSGALEDPKFKDVVFVVEDREKLAAHSIILAAASELFARIFLHQPTDIESSSQNSSPCKGLEATWSDVNTGQVEGLSSIKEEEGITQVSFSTDIKSDIFRKCLRFIYTGTLDELGTGDHSASLAEVVKVARILKFGQLVTLCENFENKDTIAVTHRREMGSKLKDTFHNKPSLADVVFMVEDQKIFAHKVVLSARSNYMAAMLSGNFVESKDKELSEIRLPDISVESFLVFLDYLYSDHPALESCKDIKAVISLADRFCHPRLLSVCEKFIADEIERQCRVGIETVSIDVVEVLQFSKIYNAQQLPKFCLHFIAMHYLEYSNKGKLRALDHRDREYVESKRWPPESYVKDLEKYEKKKKSQQSKKSDKCVVT